MARRSIASIKKAEDKDEKKVFEMYYEYEEPIKYIVPHRTLAINRGEKEEILKVSIHIPLDRVLQIMEKEWIPLRSTSPSIVYVREAIEDGYKRLIQPSIDRELRNEINRKSRNSSYSYFFRKLT